MVDFNESEGESAFLVVRSTKGVWFDNPHVFHRSLAKVPISFCFAEGAQVQTELGPTASVKVGGYFASSAEYEEWYQRRRASLTLPPSLGAEVRTRTPGSALSLRCPRLQTFTFLPRAGVRRQQRRRCEGGGHHSGGRLRGGRRRRGVRHRGGATIKSARLPTHSFTCTPLSLHVGRRRLDRLGQGVSSGDGARPGGERLAFAPSVVCGHD